MWWSCFDGGEADDAAAADGGRPEMAGAGGGHDGETHTQTHRHTHTHTCTDTKTHACTGTCIHTLTHTIILKECIGPHTYVNPWVSLSKYPHITARVHIFTHSYTQCF